MSDLIRLIRTRLSEIEAKPASVCSQILKLDCEFGMAGKPRRNDKTLIDLLAAGRSNADAARLSGMSVRTVDRRMADSDFRQRLDVRRAEMSVIDGAVRLRELVSIESRLAEMERQFGGQQ